MADEKITCRACGAEFDSRDQLDRHNRREHAPEDQPHSPLSAESSSSTRREDGAAGAESVE